MSQTLFYLLFSTLLIPQMSYDLSNSTIEAFKKVNAKGSASYITISELELFKDLLNNQSESTTVEFLFEEVHWSNYDKAVVSLPKKEHVKLSGRCKTNMSSSVSQTSSDRKFWQRLYAVHSKYSR